MLRTGGLLKAFFDLLPQDALERKVAIPIAAGGGPAHRLVIAHALRPLLASVGALVVSVGVYGMDGQFRPDVIDRHRTRVWGRLSPKRSPWPACQTLERGKDMVNPDRRLGIYYEHQDWYRPLFEELDRRGVPHDALHAGEHHFDPSDSRSRYSIVLNRMSPSAHMRGGGDLIFYTLQFLEHLERLGVRIINGARAWRTEISKARQLSLLARLELPYPRARVIHRAAQAGAAARGLRFPVVVKPNGGGSGAGILRFDTLEALESASSGGSLSLGVDGTALVQECIPPDSGRIVRVEVLNGRFLYAIRIYTTGETFNLCPADVCQSVDGAELVRAACPVDAPKNDLRVERYTPPPEIVKAVERTMSAAGIELGGIEYMVDARDGRLYFYDINALSNFVADAPRIVGFDAFSRLADWLESELAAAAPPAVEVV